MKYAELSLEKLREVCKQAAKDIKEKQEVDLLIYVARAGLPIAVYMNEIFNVKLLGIGAQRKGNSLKSKVGPLVAYCPRFIRNIFITIELKSKVHKKNTERHVEFHKSIEKLSIPDYKHILIVDDSVDTGNSMKLVSEIVQKTFEKAKVSTYSLNVWKQSKTVFKTDYCSYNDTVIRAPMSKDSREYGAFCIMYDKESKKDYI